LITNHGIVEGTKIFNTYRLYIIKSIEHGVPDNPPFLAVSEKHKFPSKLYKLLDIYLNIVNDKCVKSERFLRSLLYVNRLAKGNNKIDLTEITKNFEVRSNVKQDFRNFIRRWKSEVNFNHSPDLITEPTEKIVNNGPNGLPKWQSANSEAKALLNSPLWFSYENLCNLTGNQNLAEYIIRLGRRDALKGTPKRLKNINNVKIRVVTSFPDKGNKSRNIAISEYWTQILLNPLMKDIQKLIDTYFNGLSANLSHSEGFKKLKENIRPGIESYDVSSWTDAFPSSLQKIVLEELYSPEFAENWYNLVVSCNFDVIAEGQPNLPKTVKYCRGQGMGTKGSFDIATITDLFVLTYIYESYYKISYKDLNETIFNKVGDDLWCYDPAKHIYKFYVNELGIDININKTKTATPENLVGEYVSRNINRGVDVSRISANICKAVKEDINNLPQLAKHLAERGVHITLPLDKWFNVLKPNTRKLHIRTFYLMCLMYPNLSEFKIIKKSLMKHFCDEIYADIILAQINHRNIKFFRYSFLLHAVKSTLLEIEERMKKTLFAQVPGYECSLDLIEDSIKENSFKYRETESTLEDITSRYILAKCHRLINSLYQSNKQEVEKPKNNIVTVSVTTTSRKVDRSIQLNNLEEIFNKLNAILQGLTFEELGRINIKERKHFYVSTKLAKFIKSLSFSKLTQASNDVSLTYNQPITGLIIIKEGVKEKNSFLNQFFLPKTGTFKLLPIIRSEDLSLDEF
jgi:hypothetical protein